MAQPTPYTRQYNFTNFSTLNPTQQQPGLQIDAELSAVKTTLDQTLANLRLIQRDDGGINNLTVGYDQLKAEVFTNGINYVAPWLTGTSYTVGRSVSQSNVIYRCLVAHTSGTFATDLAAGKWTIMIDLSSVGSFTAGTFTGNGVTTAYNLGVQIVDANRVIWTENGVVVTPGSGYTVSGTTLTRTVAPGGGVAISWRLLGSTTLSTPSDNSVSTSKLVDGAVTTVKIADLNVTLAKLASDSVDSSKVVVNSLVFNDLQQISTQRIVGRNTAAAGDMEQVTLSQVLDWLGTSRGSIIYRGAATWNVLGPGLDGQVLTTKGGTADPQWGGGSGATGGGVDKVFVQNDQAVTTDYTIPATQNAMSTGPITINTGITVTVSTGAVWVIL